MNDLDEIPHDQIDDLDFAVEKIPNMVDALSERVKKAVLIAFCQGQVDGGHHKQNALDMIIRELTGCPTVTKESTNINGELYTYETLGENVLYEELVRAYERPHGEEEKVYEYDKGIPA